MNSNRPSILQSTLFKYCFLIYFLLSIEEKGRGREREREERGERKNKKCLECATVNFQIIKVYCSKFLKKLLF
jgi:hypothetical protein